MVVFPGDFRCDNMRAMKLSRWRRFHYHLLLKIRQCRIKVMHSVIETPIFTKRRAELIRLLAENPRQGDVIPGTGGVRKLRFAGSGRGKRGGVRVIWYVASDRIPVYALLIYGKNEQDDLTPDQKKAMTSMVERIKRSDQGGT